MASDSDDHSDFWDSYDDYRDSEGSAGSGSKHDPSNPSKPPTHSYGSLVGEFRYIDHRTFPGRVVLEFLHLETGTLVAKFFNVDTRSYRTGHHGQFTSRPRQKFQHFWRYMMDSEPEQWCRIHWKMHLLKHVSYRGKAVYRKSGKSGYWELENVRKL